MQLAHSSQTIDGLMPEEFCVNMVDHELQMLMLVFQSLL